MKIVAHLLLLCCMSALSIPAVAQTAPSDRPAVGSQVAPSQVYDKILSNLEKEIVELAEAMPEDKYNFVPSQGEYTGVNNFGQQVRHVAESNYYFFGKAANADPAAAESIKNLKTKAEMVQALKGSFAVAHRAIGSLTAQNAFTQTDRGTLAGSFTTGMTHMMDHYGQLVEYLRLNGIIPPASRKK